MDQSPDYGWDFEGDVNEAGSKKKKKMAIDASLGQSIKLKKMVILLLQIDAGIPPTF